jgi:hypothetical protein
LIYDKITAVSKIVYCGYDCNQCLRYIATQNGTEQLKQVAILWNKLGYRSEIEPPEKISCYGCSSALWCRHGIRECAMEAKIDNCGRCRKYPCDKTEAMFNWASKHAERMKSHCSQEEYEYIIKAIKDRKYNLDKEHGLFQFDE